MRILLNIIWLVLAGSWTAIGYLIAAILMFVFIITIPFGVQAIKDEALALLARNRRGEAVEQPADDDLPF